MNTGQRRFPVNASVYIGVHRWFLSPNCMGFIIAALLLIPATAVAAVEQVVVVFKQHYDLGYTKLASEVLEYYRTEMMDKALATCAETDMLPPEQRFVWTMPGWPMWHMLGPQQTPERREAILQRVREGRFVVHALPFTTHTESLELEDLVRGLWFAVDVCNRAGVPMPRDAKMTDVPSHSWVLPTLLKHAGVEFLHIGGNSACPGPSVPPLFWWEGPDGSRLLTMSNVGYGTGLVPPADWPHKTWLALIHTGDNQGPPSVKDVEALLAEAKEKLPGVAIRMGRLSDFSDAILAEHPDLPVVRGDMPDTWIHGIASLPEATATARRCRPLLGAYENLVTFHGTVGGIATPPFPEFNSIHGFEQSLLYGEHTWGYDIGHFGERLYGDDWRKARRDGRYARLEQSWADHAAYAMAADSAISDEFKGVLQALAARVAVSGPRVVVFNPLPWPRSDVVALPEAAATAFHDVEGFLNPGLVSALGYKSLRPEDILSGDNSCRADAQTGLLENEWFTIRFDKERGGIVSLVDRRTGREWVDGTSEFAVGQFLHEKYDSADAQEYLDSYPLHHESWVAKDFGKPGLPDAPHETQSPRFETCTASSDSASAALELKTAAGDGQMRLRITVYETLPAIDVTWSIEEKTATPWPEAGWLCFPFAVQDAKFRLGRLGGIVDPATDIVPGANRDVFCLNTGVRMIAPDGSSVGLCPLDSPLVSLERRGLWKYSPKLVPQKGTVLVNLFNNLWSTNFAQWVEGSITSRVRIWLQTPEEGVADFIKRCWEARVPLQADYMDSEEPGTLPPDLEGVRLSRDGVLVTAFGPNPYGEGTLLRLWEQAGQGGSCEVRVNPALGFTKARPVNLRGTSECEETALEEGLFCTTLDACAPRSLVLSR